MFSNWTINYRKFYLTMQDVYKYHKFAPWIYDHKQSADEIHAKDGFMVALRYDIQVQANTFAHRVTNPEGSLSVADISIMQPKVQQSCYATACPFNKLEFGDVNPYAEGKAREDWDPTTGAKKSKKAAATATKTAATSNTQSTAKGKQPLTSTPKLSNYDPNYSNCYRKQGKRDRNQQSGEGSSSKQPR
jgi:hypothetical protein